VTSPDQAGKQGRIVIVMDSNAESLARLRRVASLAADLKAELSGLFVEDVNLLRMSELPGHEIGLTSGASIPTSRSDMEQQLRLRANAARREVERVALAHRLTWTFEVRRSGPLDALREAIRTTDLVCSALAQELTAVPSARPSPSPAYAARIKVKSSPILVLFEGGDHGWRVLDIAMRAAEITKAPLEVLVPVQSDAAGEQTIDAVKQYLPDAGSSVWARHLAAGEKDLLDTVAKLRGRLLIVDAAGPAIEDERLAPLLAAANCEVLMVSKI